MSGTSAIPDLAARMRGLHVDLREDLDFSRQIHAGKPAYLVRDPVSFKTHRFDAEDYAVLTALDANQSLGATFKQLLEAGKLADDQEEKFYEFILSLHRAGFLNLPLADGRLLYQRFKAQQAMRRKNRFFSIICLDIPLWNPDRFLNQTVRYVRPVFSRAGAVVWAAVVALALYLAITRRHELAEPLTGLLAARNLLIMWAVLSCLKFFHEMGHAYACKYYGLHVPMLGVYLVVGTPCAYVDASASWGLPSRARRIFIALAGMYVEMFIAALALIVWAVTMPGLINSIAFNVALLASVTTVLFNLNPLMRYDGYFVLSDILNVPNLGQRAHAALAGFAKRRLLGMTPNEPVASSRHGGILLLYGMAAPLYRLFVMAAITVLLASRFYMIGLLMGVLYLAFTLVRQLRRMTAYLWFAEETAPVRGRAVACSVVGLVGVPAVLALLPIRISTQVSGVALAGVESVVRAETAGFVTEVLAEPGEVVRPDQPIVVLANDAVDETLTEARVRLEIAQLRRDAYRPIDPGKAMEEDHRVAACREELAHRRRQADALEIRTSQPGRVCRIVSKSDTGSFVPVGGEIAAVASGPSEVRALLDSDQFASVRPVAGQTVECRLASAPGRVVEGVIDRVGPAGERSIPLASLTHVAGGDIQVGATGDALQPYFLVVIRLDENHAVPRHGAKVRVRMPGGFEPLALHCYRYVARFIDTLQKS